jgi:hypothetical protein
MHFGRLNAIDIMDCGSFTYEVTMPARVSDALRSKGIISCRSVYHPRTDPLTAGDLLIDLMVVKSEYCKLQPWTR